MPPGDPALLAFLARDGASSGVQNALASSDLDMIRVLTDLPPQAQQKLARRHKLRSKLSDLGEIVADMDEVWLP